MWWNWLSVRQSDAEYDGCRLHLRGTKLLVGANSSRTVTQTMTEPKFITPDRRPKFNATGRDRDRIFYFTSAWHVWRYHYGTESAAPITLSSAFGLNDRVATDSIHGIDCTDAGILVVCSMMGRDHKACALLIDADSGQTVTMEKPFDAAAWRGARYQTMAALGVAIDQDQSCAYISNFSIDTVSLWRLDLPPAYFSHSAQTKL